jgi:hypothetical protein
VPLVVGVCLQPAGGLAMAFGCLVVAKGVRRRRRLALAARGPLVPRRRTVVRPLSFAAFVAIVVSQHDGGYRAPDPAVAPGEVFNEATLAYLHELVANGGFVEGATDPTLEKLRVTA